MRFEQQLRESERGQLIRALQTVTDRNANVMFYGFGGVAEEAIKCLIDSSREIRPRIGTIAVALRNIDDEASRFFDECNTKTLETGVSLEYHLIHDRRGKQRQALAAAVRRADVLFLTLQATLTDAGGLHGAALRNRQTAANLPAVRSTIQLLDDAFPQTWITVSNQPEILNYAIALELMRQGRGECIERLVGFSQPDKVRLDTLIREALIDKGKLPRDSRVLSTSAYTIGHHNDPWPIVDAVTVSYLTRDRESGVRLERTVFTFNTEEQRQMYDALRVWPGDSSRLSQAAGSKGPRSPTQESTAAAIRDCVEAVLGESRMVNASVPYATPTGVLFAQLPVVFSGRKPLIYQPPDKELIPEQQKSAWGMRIAQLAETTQAYRQTGMRYASKMDNTTTPVEGNSRKDRGTPKEKQLLTLPESARGLTIYGIANERVFTWQPWSSVEARRIHMAPAQDTLVGICQTAEGIICAGTSGTVYRLNPGQEMLEPIHKFSESISAITGNRDGVAIALDQIGKVGYGKGRKFDLYRIPERRGAFSIAGIADTTEAIIGGARHAYRMDMESGEIRETITATGWVNSIVVCGTAVFASTTKGGVLRWNPGEVTNYQTPEQCGSITLATLPRGYMPDILLAHDLRNGVLSIPREDIWVGRVNHLQQPTLLSFLGIDLPNGDPLLLSAMQESYIVGLSGIHEPLRLTPNVPLTNAVMVMQ